jgi:plasmid maintenance system antidote protein VapI
MTVTELKNIKKEAQKLINEYIKTSGKSIYQLGKAAKVHPLQLRAFLNNEGGLTEASLGRLGEVMEEKK